MNPFLENLKRQAEENPMLTLGIAGTVLAGLGKVIAAIGHSRGSHAYARQVNYRIKKSK